MVGVSEGEIVRYGDGVVAFIGAAGVIGAARSRGFGIEGFEEVALL